MRYALLLIALTFGAAAGFRQELEVLCANIVTKDVATPNCSMCKRCEADGTVVRDHAQCSAKCREGNCQCVVGCGQTH